jgi:hypothetical protein
MALFFEVKVEIGSLINTNCVLQGSATLKISRPSSQFATHLVKFDDEPQMLLQISDVVENVISQRN